jgi:hypothetical protein
MLCRHVLNSVVAGFLAGLPALAHAEASHSDDRATGNPSGSTKASPQQVPDYQWTRVTLEAPFAARDGAGALVFKGRMWLLGGWNPGD